MCGWKGVPLGPDKNYKLNAVYLENVWYAFHTILHQSTVIQGGVLFDGLLAELPAILDSQYHK